MNTPHAAAIAAFVDALSIEIPPHDGWVAVNAHVSGLLPRVGLTVTGCDPAAVTEWMAERNLPDRSVALDDRASFITNDVEICCWPAGHLFDGTVKWPKREQVPA